MRILGLDWGTVRVGVAITDEDQMMAFPLEKPLDNKNAIQEIGKLHKQYGFEKIIIGMPVNLSGNESESSQKTKEFADKLKKQLAVQIEYVDERFSSVASTQALHDQDIKEKDQRQIKDNIAASLLLQQYLDKNN